MAEKTLTAKVKLNIDDVEKKVKKLDNLFNNINKNLNKTSGTAAVERSLSDINNRVKQWASRQKAVNKLIKSGASSLGGFGSKLKTIFGTYLGYLNTKWIIDSTDAITSSQNKFNYSNATSLGNAGYNADGSYSDATFSKTQATMDKIYASAQKVRVGYDDTLKNVSKLITLAPDAFQGNIDNAIRFNEIMAETYALGGASAEEMNTSMYQLVQALGAGTLAGDELRSVREGAPLAYQEIEKFVQGIYDTDKSLKDLGAEGKVTSDMVVAAIMKIGATTDKAFGQTIQTFDQTWEQIKNSAIRAFTPVGDKLREALTTAIDNGLIEKVETAFWMLAKVVLVAFQIVYTVLTGIFSAVSWVAENWNWLSRTILTVLAIVGIAMAVILFPKFIAWIQFIGFAIKYYLWLGAISVKSALQAAVAWAIANWQLLLIILVISAIVVALIWLAGSFEEACGMIVGAIMTAVAFVWNLIVGIVNAIIQFLWTRLVEPWIGIIEWVLNVFNGGFNSFGDAVKNLLGNIISWFLSLGKIVTKIIDAIFGTNWTEGLNSLQDKVLSWGKNENAITFSREAPELDRWAYSDAYATGYDWGSSAGGWVSDKVSGLGNSFNLDSTIDPFASSGNTDVSNAYQEPTDLLRDIKDNTDQMVDVTDDDLSYLRDIANMEWKREFTTAEIRVDMSNYNTVNGESDLDGLVTKLSEKLYEELDAVANGVHV